MMAYPPVLRDVNGDVIPQVFDGTNWRPLKGSQSGNQQAQLLGPDGQPISSTNRLPVADEAAVNKLQAVQSLLETLGSIVATENTLAQVLAKLSDDPATQTTLVAVLQALQGTLSVQLSAAADVSDRSNRELGKVTVSGTADITDRENRKLGEVTVAGAADISDRPGRQLGEVTLSGQSVPLQTTGVYPEYRILSTDQKPDAAEVGVGAVVYEVDTQTVYMSDGTDWVMQ